MGYTTDFDGRFELDKPLTEQQIKYLNDFSDTRRMKRNSRIAEQMQDDVRLSVELPIGIEGEYFVGSTENCGQNRDTSVIDTNNPASTQPGLWCNWVPTEDGKYIEWNGGEKFYYYTEWLNYIIKHFLKRWGYTLNGVVSFQGEEEDDNGEIVVENNLVTLRG